ncbi:hypothetical protein BOX15_Mlig031691g2 [Macrostomum lignano]|uniref:Spermatogenesis-associated protein 6 N-terminal domain-containing protein n=1 Tax=Macrostomum lignano TaxID=282301 RepID=A0A267GAS0_9PLAT|nr:hypothetical protein BOX15_Mlig031691g2 [Macrostomum lignano]
MSSGGGFKCTLELTLDVVSSPGTRLPIRDDLFLVVVVFGQAKRTRLLEAAFPLNVHERFQFERLFWTAEDAFVVADLLADAPVTLELRQVTDIYLGGCLLAYHETNCRDFFGPLAGRTSHSASRDILMTRTLDFPGVPPRLEFATYAAIEELLPGGGLLATSKANGSSVGVNGARRSRSRSRSRRLRQSGGGGGSGGGANNYERQTLAAAMRSRSPSPRLKALCDDLDEPSTRSKKPPTKSAAAAACGASNGRPPFVVRRVENSLVGRTPNMHDNYGEAKSRSGGVGEGGGTGRLKRSRSAADLRRSTSSLAEAQAPSRARPRSPSPSPSRPTLSERYPALTSADLHERVADTLRRSGSPYRPYRPYYYPYYYSPYHSYFYPYYYGRYYDDVEMLERELRLARLRSVRA